MFLQVSFKEFECFSATNLIMAVTFPSKLASEFALR